MSMQATEALFDLLGETLSAPALHRSTSDTESMVRSNDPDTSHAAADSISLEAREASELFVLDLLRTQGLLTDDLILELACDRRTPWSASRLRTARKQLVDKGLVRDSLIRDFTRSGRRAVAWEAV